LQAAWEIDLFGARRAERNAAQARLAGAKPAGTRRACRWRPKTANQYYSLRACEQLLEVALQDAASRADTARLTELTAEAGFQAPATAALARASAADGNSRATAQRALCDIDVKALVALTAIARTGLRQKLAGSRAVPAPARSPSARCRPSAGAAARRVQRRARSGRRQRRRRQRRRPSAIRA
jgi:multidrug efflux system outer membrane protein